MTSKEAYCKMAMRYKEMSRNEWANFIDLIKNDMKEFVRQFRAWEKRHNNR